MAQKLLLFLLFLVSLAAQPLSSAAAPDVAANVSFAADGDRVIGCLAVTIPPAHHAYAHVPGDAGRPAEILFSVDGAGPAPVYYPAGAQQLDMYEKDIQVNVYEGTQLFFVELEAGAAGKPWKAGLSLLLCSNLNCTPCDVDFSGVIPAEPEPLEKAAWREDWLGLSSASAPSVPEEPGFQFGMADGAEGTALLTQAGSGGIALSPSLSEKLQLPAPSGFSFSLTPVYADTSVEIYGLGKALVFGVLAGLLLNLMPCVLPVLSFKMTGLLMTRKLTRRKLARFREHNIFFAAGILTLFTFLALLLGFMDMMWGQLYQSQEFLVIALMVVFLMGLSMMGVFSLPVIDMRRLSASSSRPRLQAYVTGLLSTFLATPCSGPLLGGVLSWAFTQPLPILVVVFWAVGLGMSIPYLILSIWPRLGLALPRPGAWMRVFENILGFLLLGTALYLLSILPEQKYMPTLTAMLAAAIAAYLWENLCTLNASRLRRVTVSVLFVAALAGSVLFALRAERAEPAWTAFESQAFQSQLGSRPMVVEFTADWCPNCKFVEATVFTESRVRAVANTYDADFVRVDLTEANAAGTKLLEMLGSRSIPLTAIFPAGDKATAPVVLRDVFTGASFDKAVRAALGD